MKGERIEKWKNKGISEFVMQTIANQVARNHLNGIEVFNVKVPLEAMPIIFGLQLQQNYDVKGIRLMGREIEIY